MSVCHTFVDSLENAFRPSHRLVMRECTPIDGDRFVVVDTIQELAHRSLKSHWANGWARLDCRTLVLPVSRGSGQEVWKENQLLILSAPRKPYMDGRLVTRSFFAEISFGIAGTLSAKPRDPKDTHEHASRPRGLSSN
jgi:hypothetical protein